jgi:acyl carrier protein
LPPIGSPLPYVRALVLNRWQQPVPPGVAGELYLGGDGVARGYLGRPDLTAERFVPDPFSATPGARLYKTGDLVRERAEGTLDFIGRRDQQVQLRGIRIELGEIEAVLQQHPEVAEAVVLLRATTPNDQRLVAFVVAGQHRTLSEPELKQFLRERLPEYMIPAIVTQIERMPLTANGKVDRRALSELVTSATTDTPYVAPRTVEEQQLAAIWQQLLRPQQPTPIGIHDNFFALGGHSLLATQCIFQIWQTMQVELPLRSLFNAPTIAEFAELIQAARASIAPPPALTIATLDRKRYRIKGSQTP